MKFTVDPQPICQQGVAGLAANRTELVERADVALISADALEVAEVTGAHPDPSTFASTGVKSSRNGGRGSR